MAGCVFDTEPIIAFLYMEPGHDAVARRLESIESGETSGAITDLTASEVFYLVARIEGHDGTPTPRSLRAGERDVRTLERRGVELQRPDWQIAGEVKADGGLSMADAFGVALAYERNDPFVVGRDDDFEDLPVDVTVERIGDG